MTRLSSIITAFEAEYLACYADSILPSQRKALTAMKTCRTAASPVMQAQCTECEQPLFVPHSCGHRSCPHCQHHESQQWVERQLAKQVPAEYFLVTFTLPEALRSLAWTHQRAVYFLMTRCSWKTVQTFARNDRRFKGDAGAMTVLHTHSRRLDYHPHVHLVMPAAAIDADQRLWRTRRGKRGYLFSRKALAEAFRGKMLDALSREGLTLPPAYPQQWVVDCKSVGRGDKALVYLGRYLYRGVIREQDIVACDGEQVTFRYRDSKTRRFEYRALPGAQFLALICRHILPKGFRRARNFGFLHANSKRKIQLLKFLFGLNPNRALAGIKQRPKLQCPCCGADMAIVRTRILARQRLSPGPVPLPEAAAPAAM